MSRVREREEERRGEKGREDNGRKSEEKGVRKEDEKGDSKIVKDVTGWTVVTKKQEAKEDGPDLRQGERVQDDPDGGEPDG